MPSFIRDDAEFDAALAAVEPLLKSKLGDSYVLLALSKGGWVRYFSKSPIVYPSDLANIRFSINSGDEKIAQILQSFGARVVKGTVADYLLRVNSNTVDATCESPIYIAALWSQLRGKVAYMSSFKVAPFIGAIVFNRSSWERVPAELRPRLELIVEGLANKISLESAKLEADAIAALDGIMSPRETAEAETMWSEAIAQRRDGLISRMFPDDILYTMDTALVKVRKAERRP
jgi:TRAP-type C4-dicarboxylate transport system substrate-binding protein